MALYVDKAQHKVGIRDAQCATDFREFNKRNPTAMTYLPSEKRRKIDHG